MDRTKSAQIPGLLPLSGRPLAERTLVCTENLNPDVMVMKPAKDCV
jgi:hypothetical protein